MDLSLSLGNSSRTSNCLSKFRDSNDKSYLSNLDLSLSLGSWYSPLAPHQIQENLDSEKRLGIVNPEQIPVVNEEVHEVVVIEEPPLPLAHVVNLQKVLTISDINNCSRFLIPKWFAEENVMPFLNDEDRTLVSVNGGLNVSVYDNDTQSEHFLQFKFWQSSASFVFTGWPQFTNRRSLKEGDTISLSFYQNRFYFSVLQRAQQHQQ